MNDELLNERINEWMQHLGTYLPRDSVNRLLSDEKYKSILRTLFHQVAPEEKVKQVQRLLLLSKLISESNSESKNFDEAFKQHELVKRFCKLKAVLKEKEQEVRSKQSLYMDLVNKIEKLAQEAQLTNSAIEEEKKKVLFMELNKQNLKKQAKEWETLQEVVFEAKEVQSRKMDETKSTQSLNIEIMDGLNECQSYVSDAHMKLENNSSDTFSIELKQNMVNQIEKHLQHFPWNVVFHALLKRQRELYDMLKSSSEKHFQNGPVCDRSSVQFQPFKCLQLTNFCEDLRKNIDKLVSSLYKNDFQVHNIRENGLLPRTFPVRIHEVSEELKAVECHMCDINQCIQEKTQEFRNMKTPLKEQVLEVCRIMSQIKNFAKLLEEYIKKDVFSKISLNELHYCMKQLNATAKNEIKLFVEIPLVFLEKVPLPREETTTGNKLLCNYAKLHPFTLKYSKSAINLLDGLASLTPHDVVLHLFEQLSYFGALNKIHTLLVPISESTEMPCKLSSPSEGNEKLQIIYKNCTVSLSIFETNIYDIAASINIMSSHPLRAIVPKDFNVDGFSLELWENELANCETPFRNQDISTEVYNTS